MKKIVYLAIVAFALLGCKREMTKIPMDKFVGTWELSGVSMCNGMQITIKQESGGLVGRISKLNDNKYVKMFADSSDIWVSGIEQKSNFEFKVTEKKVAGELFAVYGQKTSQDFNVQFIDDNTLGFAAENSDPLKSTRVYKRVKSDIK